MAMDLGDAKLTIKVDDKGFNTKMVGFGKSVDDLGAKFKTMGKVMVGAGLAIAAALTASVISYAKAGDEIHKMAIRTGFAAETLSELRHVAMLAGADLTNIEKATNRMNKAISDADMGLETYARAFRELGLDIEDLKRMTPEEQFWAIAGALADVEDHFKKSALAQEIFGKAGTRLLPILDAGSEAIAEQRQEAHDLGIVFDDLEAQQAADLEDALGTLKESFSGITIAIAEQLAPAITDFIDNKLVPALTAIKDWIVENENLAKGLGILAGVLIGGGGILIAFGMISKAIVAINAALIVMHSLSGIGLLKVGLGLAGAAGLIIGMKKLLESEAPMPETPEIQSAQYGGIIPGPIGKPIPIIAHGGEQFLGESGGISKASNMNVYVGNFMGDELSLRDLARRLSELMGEENRRTVFTGISTGYFYGGSHL